MFLEYFIKIFQLSLQPDQLQMRNQSDDTPAMSNLPVECGLGGRLMQLKEIVMRLLIFRDCFPLSDQCSCYRGNY